jgi:hypothetical protein
MSLHFRVVTDVLFGRLILVVTLGGCASHLVGDSRAQSPYAMEVTSGLEEIYITRTTRTEYIQGTTPACSAAPFSTSSEQHYEAWSLAVRESDAKVVGTHERSVGEFTACFGPINSDGTFGLYARGINDSVPYTALGACQFMKSKPPAPKLLVLHCSADLSDLPSSYIGGYLTTSSLAPTGGRNAADVHGYLSTSIITMRLWTVPR